MFGQEEDMLPVLVEHFTARQEVALAEVTTAEGRVDLVTATINWKAAYERCRAGMVGGLDSAPLVQGWQLLSAAVPLPPDRWAARLGVKSVAVLARHLCARGLTVRTEKGYLKKQELPVVVEEITCIEAKLVNWYKGLEQSYAHRFYANASYVALANRIPRTLDVELLRERGVGCLLVEEDVRAIVPAVPRRIPRTQSRLVLEEVLWARAIYPALCAP